MLPDLPKLKADIAQVFHLIFTNRVNEYLGVIGEVPRCIIKEGRNPVIQRPDDSRDETTLNVASAETILKVDEIPNINATQRIARLDEAARDLAKQISSQAFATLTDAIDRVGNVVDAKGKPFSAETVFELLETIQLDFDEDGVKHKEITIVMPPAMTDRVQETMQQIHQDVELSKRHKEIIDKKRVEWRAREAARKLVG